MDLNPDFWVLAWEAEGCAPIHVVGEEVTRLRARLAARAKRLPAKPRQARSAA